VRFLRSILESQGGSRIQIKYVVDLGKENKDEIPRNVYLDGLFHVMLHPTAIQEINVCSISNIIEQINIFNNNGSCWTLKEIKYIFIQCAEYIKICWIMYKSFKIPFGFKKRKGLFNIEHLGKDCFKCCIACSFLGYKTKRKAETMTRYKSFFTKNIDQKLIDFSSLREDGVSLENI